MIVFNFYPNGQVEMIGYYSGSGTFESYDSLGNLIWSMKLKKGVAIDTLFINDTLNAKYHRDL